jgi:hypothetical protein
MLPREAAGFATGAGFVFGAAGLIGAGVAAGDLTGVAAFRAFGAEALRGFAFLADLRVDVLPAFFAAFLAAGFLADFFVLRADFFAFFAAAFLTRFFVAAAAVFFVFFFFEDFVFLATTNSFVA